MDQCLSFVHVESHATFFRRVFVLHYTFPPLGGGELLNVSSPRFLWYTICVWEILFLAVQLRPIQCPDNERTWMIENMHTHVPGGATEPIRQTPHCPVGFWNPSKRMTNQIGFLCGLWGLVPVSVFFIKVPMGLVENSLQSTFAGFNAHPQIWCGYWVSHDLIIQRQLDCLSSS